MSATPNRSSRVRVYDATDVAVAMRETFYDRECEWETEFDFDWPPVMQNIGDSVGVAYASDKWNPKNKQGRRELEVYKHIAESRNRILCLPNAVRWENKRQGSIRTIGPHVSFSGDSCVVMPDGFAILGIFKEANIILHVAGTDDRPEFGKHKDDGVVTFTVKHGMLGGSKMRRSDNRYQPFIFVYTPDDGVMFVIVGDELDVEKDGIVG